MKISSILDKNTTRIVAYFYLYNSYLLQFGNDDKDKAIKSSRNTIVVLSTIAVSIFCVLSFSYHTNAQTDNNLLAGGKDKYFIAKMRANYDNQQDLVRLYSLYMNDGDKALSHPNEENLEYTMQLPGEHGVQYFSFDEIRLNAASLKAQGVDIISYDLEREYSSDPDLKDPVATVKAASEVVHQNEMKFMISPSIMLTTDFGTQFAPLVDMYNIQAQSLQSKPNEYDSFVEETVRKLRSANPEISISVQVSTARGSLESMKRSISSVADIVDGTTSWYTDDRIGLDTLEGYIEWFDNKYRQGEQ